MRTWNDQLSQRTSPPPTVTFEPCGVTMSTGFGTDRYLPESSYASLGTSVGVGSAPKSVTESTVPAAMSTVASRPSIAGVQKPAQEATHPGDRDLARQDIPQRHGWQRGKGERTSSLIQNISGWRGRPATPRECPSRCAYRNSRT